MLSERIVIDHIKMNACYHKNKNFQNANKITMKTKITLTFIFALLISLSAIRAQMRVHLINVGQGCATLVEFPCAAILIDVGGETNPLFNSSDSLMAYLNDFFDIRTDLNHTFQCIYLTHPHSDHTNTHAVSAILQPPFIIKNVVTDGLERGSGRFGQKKLHRAVQDAEDNADANDDIGFEAVTTSEIGSTGFTNPVIDPVNCSGTNPVIKILWGTSAAQPSGWSDGDFDEENNHSLVIKIEYGTSSLLITGDLEDKAQASLLAKYSGSNILDADVYVVGHHGSKNGSSINLLNKITPQIALIGVGDTTRKFLISAWAFGHPNKGILDRLQNVLTKTRTSIQIPAGNGGKKFVPYIISKAIYATAWDNNIVLEADATGHWQKLAKLVPTLVNINTATLSELLTLPGIGETKAREIINFRTSHGNFTSIEALDNVPGIGPATINLLRPYVKF